MSEQRARDYLKSIGLRIKDTSEYYAIIRAMRSKGEYDVIKASGYLRGIVSKCVKEISAVMKGGMK
jgi:hypothetical protein